MATNWLDTVIPLAKAVPVRRGFSRGTVVRPDSGDGLWVFDSGEIPDVIEGNGFFVDTEDPQGFGYALRLLLSGPDGVAALQRQYPHVPTGSAYWALERRLLLHIHIDDTDRISLDRAIAEVF